MATQYLISNSRLRDKAMAKNLARQWHLESPAQKLWTTMNSSAICCWAYVDRGHLCFFQPLFHDFDPASDLPEWIDGFVGDDVRFCRPSRFASKELSSAFVQWSARNPNAPPEKASER